MTARNTRHIKKGKDKTANVYRSPESAVCCGLCLNHAFARVCLAQGPPLWSSGQSSWLLTQRSWVRFLALPDFLGSSGSGTGSTQPL
jgi:hypothetical protein